LDYDNKAYVITYTAETSQYSDYLKTAQKMINSFEIKSQVNARRPELAVLQTSPAAQGLRTITLSEGVSRQLLYIIQKINTYV